ncbi:nickel pincer cofactor biosynthesis protein LarC [Actinoplanes sp. LDG1-06]|uniref:Pyridinium-3,5-bisthiocarboxylic acid mononucleotide nickel insertion protein n=2 Tax=Paractinoplanes ovalisporus TaxID=2810368 RepID=A0ABS2A397_9ACTN|nr:nickel pincer cofactor biosynthesis protein LarC [Actinoplanes ovalisporus]
MLLGALLDAGASLTVVQSAVDAVSGGTVQIRAREVTRGGMRALKADVEPLVDDPPHRTWRDVRDMLERAGSSTDTAVAVFRCLAEAEARVHGTKPDDVHFHEVGALDAIADVVGCCAALADLGVSTVSAGPVALGSGSVRTRHGRLPVPAPAVAELAKGWQVSAGGDGELATPTGLALLRSLARACEPLPPMTLDAVGIGAGTRDPEGHANVVRVMISSAEAAPAAQIVERDEPDDRAVLLEANVDDLDPRLWPGILNSLLTAGASDAWLVPIVMKKGRPAHTLSVLCPSGLAGPLRDQIFRDTSTLGVRHSPRGKVALERSFADVTVHDTRIPVKVAHRDGVVLQVMPEFEDVAALARRQDRPERLVLQDALAAASGAGLIVGAALPDNLRPAQ